MRLPLASPILATSVVTVLLPLVPVMPITNASMNQAASSTSLAIGTPAFSAASSAAKRGTPGDTTI
jgi:hypothetical protein